MNWPMALWNLAWRLPKPDLDWFFSKMDIGWPGYLVLFGLLFSCGLGVPLPEDIPLAVAGALCGITGPDGVGKMNLWIAGVAAWCGIIGGDCVLYYMGHKYGTNITKVPFIGKHVTMERIERAKKLFARWGVLVVGIGRMFAGIRGAMVIAAGTTRFHFLTFIIADGLGAIVSGGLFVFLGYKFGQNRKEVAEALHRAGGWIFVALGGVVLLIILYQIWKRRSRKTPSEAVADCIACDPKPPQQNPGDKPAQS